MAESVRLAPATAAMTTPSARPTKSASATVVPQRRRSCARAAIQTACTALFGFEDAGRVDPARGPTGPAGEEVGHEQGGRNDGEHREQGDDRRRDAAGAAGHEAPRPAPEGDAGGDPDDESRDGEGRGL